MIVALAYENGTEHDPEKLLKLRTVCLKDSPNLTTTYCDNYAETYSRIPKPAPQK